MDHNHRRKLCAAHGRYSQLAIYGDSAVHYRRRGQVFFRVPSAPRALALIERGPTVTCNHTYVSRLHPTADVIRLIVLLRDVALPRPR